MLCDQYIPVVDGIEAGRVLTKRWPSIVELMRKWCNTYQKTIDRMYPVHVPWHISEGPKLPRRGRIDGKDYASLNSLRLS